MSKRKIEQLKKKNEKERKPTKILTTLFPFLLAWHSSKPIVTSSKKGEKRLRDRVN